MNFSTLRVIIFRPFLSLPPAKTVWAPLGCWIGEHLLSKMLKLEELQEFLNWIGTGWVFGICAMHATVDA